MPLKNPKAKGTRLEHKSLQWLQAKGFQCIRSAGSLGPWDLVAFNKSFTLLIQVKCGRMPSKEERSKMEQWPQGPFVLKEIHVWRSRAAEPEVHYVNGHVEEEMQGKR